MLRYLGAGLVILMPALSWANAGGERLGDYLKYSVSGAGWTGTFEEEVVQYDVKNKSYLVRSTLLISGDAPDVHDAWVSGRELFTKKQGLKVVADCKKIGGQLYPFKLGNQSYNLCRLYWNPNAFDDIGPFPIDGRGRIFNRDDADVSGKLIDYRWGPPL
jgi:hypothetical protein